MVAANTKECLQQFVGKRLIGVIYGDPTQRPYESNSAVYRTLVFDDGSGLVSTNTGAFWDACVEDIQGFITYQKQKVEKRLQEFRYLTDLETTLAACKSASEGAQTIEAECKELENVLIPVEPSSETS